MGNKCKKNPEGKYHQSAKPMRNVHTDEDTGEKHVTHVIYCRWCGVIMHVQKH